MRTITNNLKFQPQKSINVPKTAQLGAWNALILSDLWVGHDGYNVARVVAGLGLLVLWVGIGCLFLLYLLPIFVSPKHGVKTRLYHFSCMVKVFKSIEMILLRFEKNVF